MREFNDIRASLRVARDELYTEQDALRAARQEVLRSQAAYEKARRSGRDDAREFGVQLDAARGAEAKLRARVAELKSRLLDAGGRYSEAVDPTIAIGNWSDDLPVLLLPVRLEARFRDTATGEQLWVRAYPDDCSIDTFEPELSETEIKNVERYWIEWWQAGGDEPQRRSAWRNLVASHGPGRADWITRQYGPVHLQHEPSKTNARELILVVLGARPAAQQARDELAAYWVAVWRAAGDTQQIDAALARLEAFGFSPPGPRR